MEEITGCLALAVVEVAVLPVRGQDLFQPHPGDDDVSECLQVHHAVGKCGLDIAGAEHPGGHRHQALPGRFESRGHPREFATAFGGGGGRVCHRLAQGGEIGAVAVGHLSAQQVQALDAVGALVDRVEPVIPVVLFDVVLPAVAVAAEDLDRQAVGLQAPLRRPTLGDRGQDVEQHGGGVPVGLRLRFDAVRDIDQFGAVQQQCHSTFGIGFLRQQHPLDVGVLDDRDLRCVRVFGGDGSALRALAGVLKRFEVSGVAQRHRAYPDAEAGLVHHGEHVGDAAVWLTDQITDRAGLAVGGEGAVAEIQDRVGDAALTHFVVQPGQCDVISRAGGTVVVDEVLRDDEQRDALGAGRSAGNLGQHQIDDVVGHVVFGTRYPHLGSEQPVAAVGLRFGAGGDVGQRRPGLGFRERHGAGEATGQHRCDEGVDLFGCAERGQQVGVGHAQHQISGGADVGGGEPGEGGLGHRYRQLRAAELLPHRHRDQVGLRDRVERLFDLGDDVDPVAVEGGFLGVALFVVVGEVAGGQLLTQVQHRLEGVTGVLGEPLLFGQFVDPQPVEQQKIEVPARYQHGLHGRPP